MAAVVDEEEIAGLGFADEAGEGGADVLAGGLGVGVVGVDEDSDVFVVEAVALHQALPHPLHVVDAAPQLRLRLRVTRSALPSSPPSLSH